MQYYEVPNLEVNYDHKLSLFQSKNKVKLERKIAEIY